MPVEILAKGPAAITMGTMGGGFIQWQRREVIFIENTPVPYTYLT